VTDRLVLAEELRSQWAGLRLITDLQGGSFKSQFKRADRSGAELALVLGDDEIRQRRITVKFLQQGRDQASVPRENLGAWLREMLASTPG
jgi:histidyl-tRNA synthetase